MLGPTYRYQVHNATGVTVTMTVDEIRWKFGASNARTDSAEQSIMAAQAVTTGAYDNSSSIDNSSDKYVGAVGTALFDIASSSTGLVRLILQQSTDGGTTWPSDGEGLDVASVYFSASAVDVTTNYQV